MITKQLMMVCLGMFVVSLTVGCSHKQIDMEEMMKPPARPVELDHLNKWVGEWEGEGTMEIKGMEEKIETSGHSKIELALDGWAMTEQMEWGMGDQKMKAMSLWAWDARSEVFRIFMVDNMGNIGTGKCWYDEEDAEWEFCFSSKNTIEGMRTAGEGESQFIDAKTVKWEWEEGHSWLPITFMEGEGVMRKK